MKRLWLCGLLGSGVILALTGSAAGKHVVLHGGPFGGVVTQMLVHLREPDTLYLAAFGSGVYKSIDRGRRWVLMSRGLEDPTVLTLAMDPADPGILYAGTDSGVFAWRDESVTWRRTGLEIAERNIRSLVVVPGCPAGLYAASDQGVLWSGDAGATWSSRSVGLESLDIRVLRLDPARPGGLYAAGFGGVFHSEEGREWRGMNQGLTERRVRVLAADPTRLGVWFAGTAGRGVFMSADGGRQWQPLNEGLGNLTVLSLLVTPRGERFTGTVGGVFRWDARGSRWELVGAGVLTLTITFVVADPHRPGTLYAGTGGLVFVSEDHGRQWRELALSVATSDLSQPAGLERPAAAQSRDGRR